MKPALFICPSLPIPWPPHVQIFVQSSMVLNKTCLSTPLFLQVLYLEKKKKNICRSSAVCRGNLRLSAEGDPGLGYFSFGDAPRLPALPAGSGAAVDAEGPVTAALLSGGGAGGARAAVPRGGRPGPLPPPPEPAQGPGPLLLPGRCGGREGKASPRRWAPRLSRGWVLASEPEEGLGLSEERRVGVRAVPRGGFGCRAAVGCRASSRLFFFPPPARQLLSAALSWPGRLMLGGGRETGCAPEAWGCCCLRRRNGIRCEIAAFPAEFGCSCPVGEWGYCFSYSPPTDVSKLSSLSQREERFLVVPRLFSFPPSLCALKNMLARRT